MADILDQKAIDDLLNSTLDFDETAEETEEVHTETAAPSKSKRIIKPTLDRKLRFDYRYNSPIVKKNSIIIDPLEEQSGTPSDKPVVWTIKNYNLRRRSSAK
ncbi:hypothetical protein ACFL6L_02225 [candidate division KSB1 bacterium]